MTKDYLFKSELKAKQAVQTCLGLQSWATVEKIGNGLFKVTCSELLSGVIEFRFKNDII